MRSVLFFFSFFVGVINNNNWLFVIIIHIFFVHFDNRKTKCLTLIGSVMFVCEINERSIGAEEISQSFFFALPMLLRCSFGDDNCVCCVLEYRMFAWVERNSLIGCKKPPLRYLRTRPTRSKLVFHIPIACDSCTMTSIDALCWWFIMH